jgi:hypothetical protein
MTESPLVELKSVSKKFQLESGAELKVLEGENLALYDGDVVLSKYSNCLKSLAEVIGHDKFRAVLERSPANITQLLLYRRFS